MILELALGDRKKRCFGIFKYVFDRLSNREELAAFKGPVHVPEGAVRDLVLKGEGDDFGKLESEPKAGRIAEPRALLMLQYARCKPSMFPNPGNKFLLLLVQL